MPPLEFLAGAATLLAFGLGHLSGFLVWRTKPKARLPYTLTQITGTALGVIPDHQCSYTSTWEGTTYWHCVICGKAGPKIEGAT